LDQVCSHEVPQEGSGCLLCELAGQIENVQECGEIVAVFEESDDRRMLLEYLSGLRIYLRSMGFRIEERNRYLKRLQIDPGGSDKIDELETAMSFLRQEIADLKK
jgi:hypothetical protein